ncbi:MAG: hypothetical protein AB7G13_09875 [Lautropia sp.]
MERQRLVRLVAVAAAVAGLGGCAVYSTPQGEVIGPAPVVVSPPAVVVSPWGGYWGPRYYGGYGGAYWGGPRYYGGPRYGRGYPQAPIPAPRPSFPSPR